MIAHLARCLIIGTAPIILWCYASIIYTAMPVLLSRGSEQRLDWEDSKKQKKHKIANTAETHRTHKKTTFARFIWYPHKESHPRNRCVWESFQLLPVTWRMENAIWIRRSTYKNHNTIRTRRCTHKTPYIRHKTIRLTFESDSLLRALAFAILSACFSRQSLVASRPAACAFSFASASEK